MENSNFNENTVENVSEFSDGRNIRKIIIPVVIAVIIAIIIGTFFGINAYKKHKSAEEYVEKLIANGVNTVEDTQNSEAAEETVPEVTAENNVDFESLQDLNKDIYAWIEIPDTSVSYPILQHPKDDSYYLTRSYDRSASYYGAVFSQAKYNTTDFTDNVTVLYGHTMRDGTMFAGLSDYMNREYFDAHKYFYIYMPESTLRYEIFAAVPFDNRNILYTWNCSQKNEYWNFLQLIINIRSMDSVVDTDCTLSMYDKIVVLSSCYPGDSSRRFLVVAKQI